MATIEEISESQKTLETLLSQKMADFEIQLQSSQHPDSFAQLTKDFMAFKDFMCTSVNLLKKMIGALNVSVDNMETRYRRKYLLFSGIEEKNNEDISDIIVSICHNNLGLTEITKASFQSCYRLGIAKTGTSRPILVKFTNISDKNSVWHKKANLKGSATVVSEFLTRRRQTLFIEARKYFGMRNVWTLDGNIIVKLPNGPRQRISTHNDLEKLTSDHPLPLSGNTINVSKMSSLKNTGKLESKPKRTTRNK